METNLSPSRSKPGKYRELELHIRKAIESGDWAPGDRLPSFMELREQFRMAPSTVSRALLQLEKDGLLHRRPGSGVYVANPREKELKGVIGFHGFVFSLRYVPYWMALLESIQNAAHEAGFEVLFLSDKVETRWEKVDGVLMHGDFESIGNKPVPPLVPRVRVIHSGMEGPTVTTDDFNAMKTATAYLLGLGHRRIGYLCFPTLEVMKPRLDGYRAALFEVGITPDPSWVRGIRLQHSDGVRGLGHDNMNSWLADGWTETGCTALLVQNDDFALGVMDSLQQAGLRVPGDVSVFGYDGTVLCEQSTPTLSSVAVPLEKIGAQAVALLIEQIQGKDREGVTITLPTQVVLRGSTAPPPHSG